MSVFGRVFKGLTGLFKGTPKRVSSPSTTPEEIHREPAVPGYDNGDVTYLPGWNESDKRFWDKEVEPEYRRYYTQ